MAMLLPTLAHAQIPWRFQMLSGGMGSTAINTGGLELNFGSFNSGSIPSGKTIDVWGRVYDDLPASQTGGQENNLSISAFSVGYSSVPPLDDAQPFFTPNGAGFPSFLLDQITPMSFEDIFLGTFDESAYLASLPVDNKQHSAALDIEIGANSVDANGNDTGNPFDPDHPSVIPGSPSLVVKAQINQSTQVPEPGTIALILGAAIPGMMLLRRRRS